MRHFQLTGYVATLDEPRPHAARGATEVRP
jgi:hypothetical protein